MELLHICLHFALQCYHTKYYPEDRARFFWFSVQSPQKTKKKAPPAKAIMSVFAWAPAELVKPCSLGAIPHWFLCLQCSGWPYGSCTCLPAMLFCDPFWGENIPLNKYVQAKGISQTKQRSHRQLLQLKSVHNGDKSAVSKCSTKEKSNWM